jgi:hypothetical protein
MKSTIKKNRDIFTLHNSNFKVAFKNGNLRKITTIEGTIFTFCGGMLKMIKKGIYTFEFHSGNKFHLYIGSLTLLMEAATKEAWITYLIKIISYYFEVEDIDDFRWKTIILNKIQQS